jgi:CubicO group peptidase (beta-lactamase class C family)
VTATPPRRSRLRCWLPLSAAAFLAGGCSETLAPVPTGPIDVAEPWVSASPERLDMDPVLLAEAARHAADIPRFRALVVARHGRIALEWYGGGANAGTLLDVRSVTKSVVSTVTGIANTGTLPNLDTTMTAYLSGGYTLDDGDRQVTIRDLLTMTSGYEWNESTGNDYNLWVASPDPAQFVLDRPQVAPPGESFRYNTAGVHLLGLVLEGATGTSLPVLAQASLFDPAGITAAEWEPLPGGHVNGGSGLDLRARDLLRLGQLFLQQGRSGDRQIVPAAWVQAATQPAFAWRRTFGPQATISYGYLWWTSDVPRAFFAWGYGGQFIYVLPDRDLVAVAATDWRDLADADAANALEAAVLGVLVDDVVPAAR